MKIESSPNDRKCLRRNEDGRVYDVTSADRRCVVRFGTLLCSAAVFASCALALSGESLLH